MHIPNREQCNWLRERIELSSAYTFSTEEKKRMLDRLAWSDFFETFLANKYAAAKRFGLEGAESLIPGALLPVLRDVPRQQVRGCQALRPRRRRVSHPRCAASSSSRRSSPTSTQRPSASASRARSLSSQVRCCQFFARAGKTATWVGLPGRHVHLAFSWDSPGADRADWCLVPSL